MGYAQQQFMKLVDRGDGSFSADTRKRTEKHARHLLRLCWQGLTLYQSGYLPIQVENPQEYHDFGRHVAEDPLWAEGTLNNYEDAFNHTTSVLPESPDEAAVDAWLRGVRAAHYAGPVHLHAKIHLPLPPEERAEKYVANLIDKGLVGYTSASALRMAIQKMTDTFETLEAPQGAK
jgi:hypothetical protein